MIASVRSIRRNRRRTVNEQIRRTGHVPFWAMHPLPKQGTRKKELRRIREAKQRARILRANGPLSHNNG